MEPATRVLVSSRLPLFHLHDALSRRRVGGLADVRLWLDGPAPAATRLGLRQRPWLSAIHHRSDAPPPEWVVPPAPVRAVSSLSSLLADWEAPSIRLGEVPSAFPRVLQLQTTTACEAHCPFCPYDALIHEHVQMEEVLLQAILDQCAVGGIDMIELFFHAEPLQDDRLARLAHRAKATCPQALITIVTHERALDDAHTAALVGCGLDAIFVSVNPLGRHSADALRRRLAPLAARGQRLRAGGTELVITSMTDLHGEGVKGAFRRICRELDLPLEVFRSTTRLGDAPVERWRSATPPTAAAPCDRPFHKAYVRHDGSVVLCCEDWRYTRVLGDLRSTPLADVWTGEAYRAVRRGLLTGRPLAPCDRCPAGGPGGSGTRLSLSEAPS